MPFLTVPVWNTLGFTPVLLRDGLAVRVLVTECRTPFGAEREYGTGFGFMVQGEACLAFRFRDFRFRSFLGLAHVQNPSLPRAVNSGPSTKNPRTKRNDRHRIGSPTPDKRDPDAPFLI